MPGRPVRFGGFRDADKENHGPPISQHHEDDSDEEDGHILYRDDDESLEEEGKHLSIDLLGKLHKLVCKLLFMSILKNFNIL